MKKQDIITRIKHFLTASDWVPGDCSVSFLAAGEHNANYTIQSKTGRFVLRINHGSQLGLGDGQIEYEYRVLEALAGSGVTPRPFACDPAPEGLEGGVLLMEYLPGTPLQYGRDLERAAGIFARVHRVQPPEGLVLQPDPVQDISWECRGLIQRYPDHPLRKEREAIEAYFQSVQELAAETRSLFAGEEPCLVNTEVNANNFLISDQGAYLVDWEKAVLSSRYQDLGHFLVPTTTLWKSETILSQADKKRFLQAYQQEAGLECSLEELSRKTRILEKTILLRALSWCYMAYYEYTLTERTIQNQDTFAKIKQYLEDIPGILASVP